jgi:hypothetical protein
MYSSATRKERAMGTERRKQERRPVFKIVELTAKDAARKERCFPIMLRDMSAAGLGGVYVGQEPVNLEDRFSFEDHESVKNLRVVWKREVAEYVSLLGFELTGG